jgi:orotate phosphoribosyltransferase-like protein
MNTEEMKRQVFAEPCTPVAVHDKIAALMELVIEWGISQGIPKASLGDTLAEILMGNAICCLSRDSGADVSAETVVGAMSSALFRMVPGRDISIKCDVVEDGETILSCVARRPDAVELDS